MQELRLTEEQNEEPELIVTLNTHKNLDGLYKSTNEIHIMVSRGWYGRELIAP